MLKSEGMNYPKGAMAARGSNDSLSSSSRSSLSRKSQEKSSSSYSSNDLTFGASAPGPSKIYSGSKLQSEIAYNQYTSSTDTSPTDENGGPRLLAGEKLLIEGSDVTYLCPIGGPTKGTLYLSNYRLFFRGGEMIIDVPLGMVNKAEKVGRVSSRGENSYCIEVSCKDVRILKFAHNPDNHSRRQVYETLIQYAFPYSNQKLPFAFESNEQFVEDGWSVYEPMAELRRQGVPNGLWKITKINENHQMCDTYPAVWAIPVAASEEGFVPSVCDFRSKRRLPLLSWLHPVSQASITRSSQPLVGVASKRSKDDELYLQYILDANAQAHQLCVLDARPSANAVANKAKGGGYESEEIYPFIDFIFLNIHNIHVMRDSLKKLKDECYPTIDPQRWLSAIESTKWLEHISLIVSGAIRIVDKVEVNKTSVLVHCSDGWDRTAQLTSLAMLLLDPFYRTLKGFEVLIEKEWLSFGHKFQQRIGHGDDKHSDYDRSPVFLQWIDCVYQVTMQFPYAFEFNEYLLITILDHLYSCRFGTFLCNSEKERVTQEIKRKTPSLWSLINSEKHLYINPFFCNEVNEKKVLFPSAAIRHLRVWKTYYCRFSPRYHPPEPDYQIYQKLQICKTQLEKKLADLKLGVETKQASAS